MKRNLMIKEDYFTNKNIDQVAQTFLKATQTVARHTQMCLNLKQTALLVIDMQNYFVHSAAHAFIPSAEAIIPKIQHLQTLFLKHNLCLIHTRQSNTAQNAGNMKTWWKHLIDRHSIDAQIIQPLVSKKAQLVDKTQYDAFYKTSLYDYLKRNNITQLIITGVMTHLCVETTARSAFMHGFEVFLPVNGTATYRRALHLASVLNLSHGFVVPTLIQSIEEQFDGANKVS
jgi:isochorismate hydrolase